MDIEGEYEEAYLFYKVKEIHILKKRKLQMIELKTSLAEVIFTNRKLKKTVNKIICQCGKNYGKFFRHTPSCYINP